MENSAETNGAQVMRPTGFTVLTTKSNKRAAKQFTWNSKTGIYEEASYDCGYEYTAMEVADLQTIDDLADIILMLATAPRRFVVRGELLPWAREAIAQDSAASIWRRKDAKATGGAPALTECALRWVGLDFDDIPTEFDLATEAAFAVDRLITDLLPVCFHDARAFFQMSNSCGFIPGVISVHVFFMLTEEISNEHLRRTFDVFAPDVDISFFNAVQPHYVADPIIIGGHDPLPSRHGWRDGLEDEVALPAIPSVARHRAVTNAAAGSTGGTGWLGKLARLGDGDGRKGFHRPLNEAAMCYAGEAARTGERDDQGFVRLVQGLIAKAPVKPGRNLSAYNAAEIERSLAGAFDLIQMESSTIEHSPQAAQSDDTADTTPKIKMPAGYGFDHGGLLFTDSAKEGAEPQWLAAPFNVVGECEDGIGGGWGIVLGWLDAAGHRHETIVPRALLHGEPYRIAAMLDDTGLRCSTAKSAQALLRGFLAAVRPTRRLHAVVRAGWHGTSYILPDGTVLGGGDLMLRPELARSDLACATAGTLADWQAKVARYAVGNSRLAMAIAAALAGSLLAILAEPSGGVHFHGVSQSGKTTIVFCAASVAGKGARDGAVHQWRATGNGLEGVAARCSDGTLMLDEIGQADAREAGEIVYQLANEQGKQRADTSGGARRLASWRLMVISTGETTLAQRMAEVGKRTHAGMEIRLVNIPSDAGAGIGAYEALHGFTDGGALSDHLRDAAATCYDTAGRAFLSQVAAAREADADGFYARVKALRHAFMNAHLPNGADGQVRSVVGRMGVIAAAGELAAAWGILPWSNGEASAAALACFKAWLVARGGSGAGETTAAIQQVRGFLELHGVSRFPEITLESSVTIAGNVVTSTDRIDDERTINRCGWRRLDAATKQWDYLILSEAWKHEICRGLDATRAAQVLADKGWLRRGEGKNLARRETVPGLGRPRLYVVTSAILHGDGGDDC
jgi:putative DNA primase/helicase